MTTPLRILMLIPVPWVFVLTYLIGVALEKSLRSGGVWPVILLPLTLAYLNWVVIPVEEGKLVEVFGTRYTEYRTRVRRWI